MQENVCICQKKKSNMLLFVIFSAGCVKKPIIKANEWEREDKSSFIQAETLLYNQKLMFQLFFKDVRREAKTCCEINSIR